MLTPELTTAVLTGAVRAHGAASATPEARPPVPVILDTDIGDDVDDTWALAMLLRRPEVDVKLIVTAFNDTVAKARLTAKILMRLGRTDIPIGVGRRTGAGPLNQAPWLGGFDLGDYPGLVHDDGIQAMVSAIHDAPEPVTLVAIGPQTNLAEALRREPSIAEKARVVAMAGSLYVGYGGLPHPSAEVNVMCDVDAVRDVLRAPWPVTWAPLDSCGALALSAEQFAEIRRSRDEAARVVVENYDQWTNRANILGQGTSILYDTVAAYLSYDETLCSMQDVPVTVDDKGFTRVDPAGTHVRCALALRDRTAFENMLIGTFRATTAEPAALARGGPAGEPGTSAISEVPAREEEQ